MEVTSDKIFFTQLFVVPELYFYFCDVFLIITHVLLMTVHKILYQDGEFWRIQKSHWKYTKMKRFIVILFSNKARWFSARCTYPPFLKMAPHGSKKFFWLLKDLLMIYHLYVSFSFLKGFLKYCRLKIS